ncbi:MULTISPECIES: hypothetical protein [unclassified Bacillus (in: firmicutes)]|uniref:hypothetical protein n=1 Tax=unclassified Bacillus (in: firmicutes) TaxID=185979 RepID=UPI000E35B2F8|nr:MULTISPECIES: hypothetical protein [unclassified Bacillus (in: firmicutes)]AXR16953.1 hypothetical protein DOS87_12825 [Bacillus sp. CR71]AXR22648.1 hypothetical protein DPQ26_12590 [Bacillus sp. E25]
MEAIFTKGSTTKAGLFDTFINIMKDVGWKVMNEGIKVSADGSVVLHSKGSLGNTPMYIEFIPYEGTNVFDNVSYDIRRGTYGSNCLYRYFTNWDDEKKTGIGGSGYQRFNFFNGRYPTTSSSGYISMRSDIKVDYYYYCDLDRVIFVTVPDNNDFTTYKPGGSSYQAWGQVIQPHINFFGIPEESYLEERNEPSYSFVIHAASSTSYYNVDSKWGADNYPYIIMDKPANVITNNSPYYARFDYMGISPGPEGMMYLTDFYLNIPTEGFRGKLGFIKICPSNGKIVNGDIIEVTTENNIERYLYIVHPSGYFGSDSNYKSTGSFFGTNIAIRIG